MCLVIAIVMEPALAIDEIARSARRRNATRRSKALWVRGTPRSSHKMVTSSERPRAAPGAKASSAGSTDARVAATREEGAYADTKRWVGQRINALPSSVLHMIAELAKEGSTAPPLRGGSGARSSRKEDGRPDEERRGTSENRERRDAKSSATRSGGATDRGNVKRGHRATADG